MDTQLKRGILEICVLKALQKEDSYGYRIIKDLSPAVTLSESTLYPILKRMEQSGCITEYSVAHNGRLGHGTKNFINVVFAQLWLSEKCACA